MGKSAAKIRRNIARAAARGETYTPPEPSNKKEEEEVSPSDVVEEGGTSDGESEVIIQMKLSAAQKLEESLSKLETNPDDLNAKERRSAKRKAEAIAVEESGCDNVDMLMAWYKKQNKPAAALTFNNGKDKAKLESAKKLHTSLSKIEKDDSLNAKERRSAKRKAEAIASEETGVTDTKELLQWYETIVPTSTNEDDTQKGTKKIPYIIFVGQLAYSTTSDMIFNHFHSTLIKSFDSELITKESMKIRLLTDSKTKKSRGMAFIELSTPEIMYECLKLHLTYLDGRRINVERSAGGGSASKKARITSFRENQSTYISTTMDSIIQSFVKNGDIEEDELDEGVISLCKRHSATVVEAALKEYVDEKRERKIKKETLGEKEEETLRNPSAFLTHMLTRIAEEGIGNSSKGRAKSSGGRGGGRREGGRGGGPGRGAGSGRGGGRGSSIQQRSSVDMSMSSSYGEGGGRHLFPSMSRGRGRGRGYM